MNTIRTARLVLLLGAVSAAVVATGCASSSSSNPGTKVYTQFDRLANPAINEVFATVANNRHQTNDLDRPIDDPSELATDVQSFMVGTAGRSQAITDVVKAVVVPDTMVVDLNQPGPAAYLGVQTNGATGGKFGGRALTDDVVDISLGVIFGNTVPALGLAPDDGKEIPTLISDHVDASDKHFTGTFPFLGAPH
jgi:hypothetical protein